MSNLIAASDMSDHSDRASASAAKKMIANVRQALELPPRYMPHVVTSKCVGCKFTDCVEVCPVACFYELDNQVLIHPEDCIDCTACVAECPVEAIYEESDVPAEFQPNIEFNAIQARQVKDSGKEAIVKKKDPLPTAEQRKTELGY